MAINYTASGGTNVTTPVDPTKKKLPNLPYLDSKDPLAIVPLSNTALNQPTAQATQLQPMAPQQNQSSAVLGAAQNQVLSSQQAQNPLSSLITQKSTDLLNNSYNAGADQKYKQNQLENFDYNNAQTYETLRQKNADISNTGMFQVGSLQNQSQALRDRGTLETGIDTAQAKAKQESLLAGLASARETNTGNQTATNSAIDNLVKVYGMENVDKTLAADTAKTDKTLAATASENSLDRTNALLLQSNDIQGNKDITSLKAKLDSDQQISSQEWQSGRDALDRLAAVALQNNDIAGQKEIANLQSDLNIKEMVVNQDFEGAQAELSRLHDVALQEGDIAGQFKIEKLRGEIEATAQKVQQEFTNGQRIATQGWQTGERISEQDYNTASKYIDADLKKSQTNLEFSNSLNFQSNEFNQQTTLANLSAQLEEAQKKNDYTRTESLTKLQSALEGGLQDDAQAAALELKNIDVATEKYLQDNKAKIDLQMQTNDMDQQTKMAYLGAQLEEAKANGDVGRQQQIITFQTTQDIKKIEATGGIEAAQMEIKNRYDLALQKNDIVAAEALKKLELSTNVSEAAKDRVLQQAQLDLEAKKVNMDALQQDYKNLIDQGMDDAAYNLVIKSLKDNGIDTSGNAYQLVDQEAKAQQALEAQYNQQKQQFLLTHPESVVYTLKNDATIGSKRDYTLQELNSLGVNQDWIDNHTTQSMTADSMSKFDQYLNKTLYGEMTAGEKAEKAVAGYLGAGDIAVAGAGDKYNLTSPLSVNGQSVPAGKYIVTTDVKGSGNTFWGTKKDTTHVYLVDESNPSAKYEIRKDVGGKSGNIISNLWA